MSACGAVAFGSWHGPRFTLRYSHRFRNHTFFETRTTFSKPGA